MCPSVECLVEINTVIAIEESWVFKLVRVWNFVEAFMPRQQQFVRLPEKDIQLKVPSYLQHIFLAMNVQN